MTERSERAAKRLSDALSRMVDTVKRTSEELSKFQKTDANAINRVALAAVGKLWIEKFLPSRFSNKARRLGWTITPGYAKRKAAVNSARGIPNTPLRYTGELFQTAVANGGARITQIRSTSTRGGVITIGIPANHPIHPKVSTVLRTIPSDEMDQMVKLYSDTIATLIAGSGDERTPRGKRLTTAAIREAGAPQRRAGVGSRA